MLGEAVPSLPPLTPSLTLRFAQGRQRRGKDVVPLTPALSLQGRGG